MKEFILAVAVLLLCVPARTQTSAADGVVINSRDAKWQHDANDPPGAESLDLRSDSKTGATEFFARYPAGFAFKPHSHKANERFLLMEGRAAIELGELKKSLDAGGFAYFPAGQTHRISCISATPCMWYLGWDGKP